MFAYGLGRDLRMSQELGHAVAEVNKCVASPDIYQHRVYEFELANRTRVGHRKILCLLLVNPETEILSTTHVPPKQVDWSLERLEQVPGMHALPAKLFDMVAGYVRRAGKVSKAHWPGMELVRERMKFGVSQSKRVCELEFSMCEH